MRIAAFRKRLGVMGPDQMRVSTGMLYSNVLRASTRKIVLARPAKEVEGKLVAARDNFKEMRAVVDEFVNVEARTRPQKMGVSSIEAATGVEYAYSKWVDWMQYCDYATDDSAAEADSA